MTDNVHLWVCDGCRTYLANSDLTWLDAGPDDPEDPTGEQRAADYVAKVDRALEALGSSTVVLLDGSLTSNPAGPCDLCEAPAAQRWPALMELETTAPAPSRQRKR